MAEVARESVANLPILLAAFPYPLYIFFCKVAASISDHECYAAALAFGRVERDSEKLCHHAASVVVEADSV